MQSGVKVSASILKGGGVTSTLMVVGGRQEHTSPVSGTEAGGDIDALLIMHILYAMTPILLLMLFLS